MALSDGLIQAIIKGQRPPEGDLVGAALDGKRLPAREMVIPWNLSEVNLRGTVFTRLDLSSSSFNDADLSGAVFRNVNLEGADFSGVSAAGVIFEDVNLAYADFSDADLRGSVFSFANLADVGFKNAELAGAAVNGVRFSMNGCTHTLAMKEALSHRYGAVSYPLVAGISGDAFWLTYVVETGTLAWGGYCPDTLACGLGAFGFTSEMVNEVDVEVAWRTLIGALSEGRGVITPIQIGGPGVTGTGFGGSEWVYVSEYDPDRDAVRVRCLLSDDLWLNWEQLLSTWCVRHPLDLARGPIVYSLCVVGERGRMVSTGGAALRGVSDAVSILDTGECGDLGAVCGIPVYDLLIRDLEADPEQGDEGCSWLGFGIRHHHGSRWAVRDFLREMPEFVAGADRELATATECYERVLGSLLEVIRILPGSIDPDKAGEDRIRQFIENRGRARRCLREARTAESEARDALRDVAQAGEPR